MAKEAYYFSHDANARNDPKISAMRSMYGTEGYGRYWIIVEMLREQDDFKLPCSNAYLWSSIAKQVDSNAEQAQTFVNDCINTFELFRSDGEYFWSESLIRRMEEREARRQKRAEAGRKGGLSKAEAMLQQSSSNAVAKPSKERKGKESKEKDKEIENTTPLEQSILDELASVKGYPYDNGKDLPHIRKLAADFPQIDLLREAKAWATYKLDKPLDAKSNPRSQFRTWCSRAKPVPTAPQWQPRQISESSREYLRLVGAAPDSKEGQV